MEKVTRRKNIVLEVLDAQIEDLEAKLAKAQPLIDELASLRRTRATLLDERRVTGGGGRANVQLSMESVIHYLSENGPSTPAEVAAKFGVTDNTVRSHFNRHADVRYRKNGDGRWALIGGDDDEDEED